MKCPRCQQDAPSDAEFCPECGAKLVVPCAQCGTPNAPGHAFCKKCGQPLTYVSVEGPEKVRLRSHHSYTPKHLADKILTSKSAMEGERKQVTVLFCDIVDSSRLAERLGPEAMHEVMDRALRLMAEAVHRYEGTVNQFLGDGLMALFGAPVALEDHAFRGVQAALAIRETLGGYSQQLEHERGVALRLRQGLNTGLVVVGRIGDDLRMDYTAVGDTTHLAARMQQLAEPGTILVTEAARRLVEGYIRSESLGPVLVKGQSAPVSVFRVVGRRRRRSRFEVHAESGLTELVGRERELAILSDRFQRVKAGRGQIVGIAGEPGVGKSRLIHEFRRLVEVERLTWLEGHCVAYGQATPYLPILEILRTNFEIEEGDNPLQMDEKLRQGVRLLDPGLEQMLPFLRELFGLPVDDPVLAHLEPKEKRQKIFEAIRALTVAGSQRRPHILIVEDLHWIDKTSEDYLAFFIESLPAIPALLLTTHRPGYVVRSADKTYYTQIALDVLTESEVEAMVSRLLGAPEVPRSLVQRLQEKAEGNPLFVEEITTSLRERGLVRRSNGGVVWASDAVVEFPETVQDIVRARLDRLEDPVKRTVQTAAVIGRQFSLNLLMRVSEISQQVQHYLDTLKQLELVHETQFFPELEYIFKHAVIQDVAYHSLLGARRTVLHGAIGRALEDLYADRLDEQAAILSYHYARSADQDKAVAYALRAGDQAARLFGNAEATTYYERALAKARALGASPATQHAQIDAACKLAAVGGGRDIERDQRNLEQALALAEALGDESRLAQVLYWLGRTRYVHGEPAAAIEYAERSLAIADKLGDDVLAALPVNLIGRACFQTSEFAKASRIMARSVDQMHRLGNKPEESMIASFAGAVFGFLGEFELALGYADRGFQVAREIQNPFAEAAAYLFRGNIRDVRGEWAEAIADFQAGRQIAEHVGDLFRVYVLKFFESHARAAAGDPEVGRRLAEESLGLAQKIATRFMLAWAKANLAACLQALREPPAVPLCHESIRLAEESGDRYPGALARRTLADALLLCDPPDVELAERALLEAIRIQEEIGARPELARSYVSYARLLKAWGKGEPAKEHLSQAIGMFRAMGMAWDLERAEQALRES